jgi:hypothetical protein
MARFPYATVVFLEVMQGTIVIGALVTTGCSSSSSPESGDAGFDALSTQEPDSSQSKDVTTNEDVATVPDAPNVGLEAATDGSVDAGADGGASTDSGAADTALDTGTDGGGSTDSGAADTTSDAGTDGGSDAGLVVDYTFDTSTQGWVLSNYADPNYDNLGAPDSGVTPVLEIDTSDGNPNPGSLEVIAPFTGYNQYVDAIVNITPAINLAGRTLSAEARLVCGSFPSGGAKLHASTGSAYTYIGGTFVDASMFTPGTWVPLTLDLTSMQPVDGGYDPTMVVQIGIQMITVAPANASDGGDSGMADAAGTDAGDGGPCSTGAAVFEIDTVTD